MRTLVTSLFSAIPDAPLDPIMRLFEACTNDPSPDKLNLVVGMYYDEAGRIPRLRAVQAAEARWIGQALPKTYRPIEGTGPFRETVTKVKREISEPLATRRELVKSYGIEDNFYGILKQADKVVKLVRGS